MDRLDKLIEVKLRKFLEQFRVRSFWKETDVEEGLQEYVTMPRAAYNVIEKCKIKATRETVSTYEQKGGDKGELYRVFYTTCLKRNIKKCNKDPECEQTIKTVINNWEKKIVTAKW